MKKTYDRFGRVLKVKVPNATERKVIGWLTSERERGSQVWPFLRKIAENEDNKYDHGDYELAARLADLLDGSAMAQIKLHELGADQGAARELVREMTEDRDRFEWLDEVNPAIVRQALIEGPRGDAT